MNQEIPKIRKVAEVGETPFQFIEKQENILQGYDKTIRRSVYLFKMTDGNWGYYDKETSQTIPINQWKGKAAMIDGRWVIMTLYHRIHLRFSEQVIYSNWDKESRKEVRMQTPEAIVTITDSAFKSLTEQIEGRDPGSLFKFTYNMTHFKWFK